MILLDFWTYSCINCLRTIPYLGFLEYQKYAESGTYDRRHPHAGIRFSEKNINNVQAAVTLYGIHYPGDPRQQLRNVDGIWQSYWPHEYLIDMAGYIVHDQVGEGNYASRP